MPSDVAAVPWSAEEMAVLHALPAAVLTLDSAGRILTANLSAIALFGHGPLAGRHAAEVLAAAGTEPGTLLPPSGSSHPPGHRTEAVALDTGGGVRTFAAIVQPLDEQAAAGSVLTLADLSGDAANAGADPARLEERRLQLRELHDRIRTDLDLLASIIGRRFDRVEDAPLRAIVRDSLNRIRAMTRTHDALGRQAGSTDLDMSAYLADLVAGLRVSFAADAAGIDVRAAAAPVRLPLNAAMNCGLIVNELVSNALRHAFPDGQSGVVDVALEEAAPDSLLLTVRDDGVGVRTTTPRQSLGLSLVAGLARQLGGDVTVDPSSPGTTVRVRWRGRPRAPAPATGLDRLGTAVVLTGPDGRVTSWGPLAEWTYGWRADEALGRDLPGLLGVEADGRHGTGWPDEGATRVMVHRHRDGRLLTIAVTAAPRGDGRAWTLTDLSAFEEVPARTASLIEACDLLVREAYHRAKNNLQVVSSLLSLHFADRSPAAARFGRDVLNRLDAVARTYRAVEQAEPGARLDAREYLAGLVVSIAHSYPECAHRVRIDRQADVGRLTGRLAARCGLLVTELLSNALGHAFPEGRAGTVHVSLRRAGPSGIELLVADDGVGLPAGVDPAIGGGEGFRLVRELSAELGATVVSWRNGGTVVRVSWSGGAEQ